jgi:hypothetical protein
MSGKRLLVEHGLHLRAQAIESTTQVGHAGCQPDLRSCAKIDQLRKLSRIDLSSDGSAPRSTLIMALPGNSMWIEPLGADRSWASPSPAQQAASLGEATTTGRSDVDGVAVSLSSPRVSARRHLNTWFAFTPCARATRATLAPGSKVSSAIRRFSDTVRHRRTDRGAPISRSSPMTTSSSSNQQSCQRGTRDAYVDVSAVRQNLFEHGGSPL